MLINFFLLKSNNIFRALSFESSVFELFDLRLKNIILFWISDPCVVIGRHQNPWNEINVTYLKENNLKFVRRASGGGTVYHDIGNLNVSFITSKSNCNRDLNMKIIANAINKNWDKQCNVGKRHEIYVQNSFKISGSASRFGLKNAYHHCTLLLSSNLKNLSQVLKSNLDIESNATQSIISSVTNLNLNYMEVIKAIQSEYLKCFDHQFTDYVEISEGDEYFYTGSSVFNKYLCQFTSNDWNFKMTPKFVIKESFFIHQMTNNIHITCEKGAVQNITFSNPCICCSDLLRVINEHFVGSELNSNDLTYQAQLCRIKWIILNNGNIQESEQMLFYQLEEFFRKISFNIHIFI